MKIMMTGGGTLGPVTPLLAVVEAWRAFNPTVEFLWVGTQTGPERSLVEKHQMPFFGMAAPKLDRHAPLRWFFIPFKLLWSLKVAAQLVRDQRPDVVVTAGGYVSVPVVWIARLFGIPVWVHQLDVKPGLANLLMAPAATGISCGWVSSMNKFPEGKTIHLGNPVRSSVVGGSRDRAAERFGLSVMKPTVLILGGGTGSTWINQAAAAIAPELVSRANILHITGRGKNVEGERPLGYVTTELIAEGMADVLALADVIVSRAGMGFISEFSLLRKAAIIVPMPDSHQEDNTNVLAELNAAIVLDQNRTSPQMLLQIIEKLLDDPEECQKLGNRLHAALPTEGVAEKLAYHLQSIAKQ